MSLKNINPTTTYSWKKLQDHFDEIKSIPISDYFSQDNERASNFSINWQDFYFDFSKNRINDKTIKIFIELLNEIDLKDAIEKQFSGVKINKTEDRSVLHTSLRCQTNKNIKIDSKEIYLEIDKVKKRIESFSESIIDGSKKGYSGKSITDVVNIGIGGSDLGPSMVIEGLKFYKNHLNTHFVSNVDGDHVKEILKKLNPETTLFIIVSKTFTTQETLSNANTTRSWFLKTAKSVDISKHFIAVSSNVNKAESFGVIPENIFPMWDWVGGRFSLWSAVGISISLAVGYANYNDLLVGANKMDIHFRNTKFEKNIPVILALLGVWYNNFYFAESECVITYSQYLNQFATYLQQASMESNGKSIDRDGNKINYQTGQIVWGEPGTNSQHAFFQLIHQGTKLIPTDFIAFIKSLHGDSDHQNKLISNFIAQTEALMNGRTLKEVISEDEFETPNSIYKVFEGNKPTNTLLIDKLTPEALGKLIATYEHKIFVQGIIWNIYSYDQFGVELGKKLANSILSEINDNNNSTHDTSTTNIINHYNKLK